MFIYYVSPGINLQLLWKYHLKKIISTQWKQQLENKACLDQTYLTTSFAPCYPTYSNIYGKILFKCHFCQVKYEETKRKVAKWVNLELLFKIIKYPAGYPVLKKPNTGYPEIRQKSISSPTLVYIHIGGTDSLKDVRYIPVWHLQIITYNDFLGNFLQPLWPWKDCRYSKKLDFSTPKKEKKDVKEENIITMTLPKLISAPVQHHPRTA